jgi:microcystin-dependent protein
MGNFANAVVTYAGLQLINEAIAGAGTVTITTAEVGSGYPATGIDPRDQTALVTQVMAATSTSANDQVLYQTTVRLEVSSGHAPFLFQLNEIGIYAQIGTGAPILFAYVSSPGQGDYLTPDPGPSPVVYDYAILIQYEQDSPVTATVTLQPVIELHAATHRGNGIDPIGLADGTASGLLSSPPNDSTKVLLGTIPQSWGPIPKHAPTHLDNGNDPVPVATVTRTGAMAKLSGNQADAFRGDGSWLNVALPAGVMMDFAGSAAPTGWILCQGQALDQASYPGLFAAIGFTYGNPGSGKFSLPDCRGRTVVGAGAGAGLTDRALGATGGEESHILTLAEMPSHTHGINDLGHIHSVDEGSGHTHGLNDGGHNHSLNEGGGHTHGITQTAHAHGVNDPAHSHLLANFIDHLHTNPNPGSGSWDTNSNIVNPQTQLVQPSKTGIGILPGLANITNNAAVTGASIVAALCNITARLATTGLTIVKQVTGISIQAAGGGSLSGSNVMQPFLALNKIIKT